MKVKIVLCILIIFLVSCELRNIFLDPMPLSPTAPEIAGAVSGQVYNSTRSLTWDDSPGYIYSATLNNNAYVQGTPISDDNYYVFKLLKTDLSSDLSITTEIKFLINTNYKSVVTETNTSYAGTSLELIFDKGSEFDEGWAPQYVIWIEDSMGFFIQNLYVCQSPGTNHMRGGSTHRANPQAVPYWAHKACIEQEYWISTASNSGKFMTETDTDAELDLIYIAIPTGEPGGPVPADLDSVTGATIYTDFTLESKLKATTETSFRILFEINRSYDNNAYYTSGFSADKYYRGSDQPSLVYAADIDLSSSQKIYELELIGSGHYAGRDGNLYPTDKHTTAKGLVDSIYVVLQ